MIQDFLYKPDPMPNFFRHISMLRTKIWAFFEGLRTFRGPQMQERKKDHNSFIFGVKIKVKSNFI
jgi:hypothetical protein